MTVRISDLSRHYGRDAALAGVELDVADGQFLALLGPSGAGKTTLLRLIAGLDRPDTGTIRIDGRDVHSVPPRERRIGFVFQNYALFRHMTVARNIAFGLSVRRRRSRQSRAQITARVDELLALMQLSGLGGRFPAQLSGGQRQRVALARALAIEPRVLLLDEPFGALDAQVRGELREWLYGLQRRLGLTTVFVTHDQHEAFQLADRVAILNRGRLEQTGTPAEIRQHPQTPFVCEFVGARTPAAAPVRARTISACRYAAEGGDDGIRMLAQLAITTPEPAQQLTLDDDAASPGSASAPVAAVAFGRPAWTPRMVPVAPPAGTDLPAVAAGELWLLEVARGNATPLATNALASANVVIYDRPLTEWVASSLPLGSYAEPATGDAVARCIQFVRDGWSVLRLIERGADPDFAAGHVRIFAERLRLAGAPAELRVRRLLAAGEDAAPPGGTRLEDVDGATTTDGGPPASAVVFGAFAIAEATAQAVMTNGLSG